MQCDQRSTAIMRGKVAQQPEMGANFVAICRQVKRGDDGRGATAFTNVKRRTKWSFGQVQLLEPTPWHFANVKRLTQSYGAVF